MYFKLIMCVHPTIVVITQCLRDHNLLQVNPSLHILHFTFSVFRNATIRKLRIEYSSVSINDIARTISVEINAEKHSEGCFN